MNRTIRGFIKKEFLQALRDIRMRAVIFVLPAVQMTIFGLALSTEVKNVRLASCARADDILMRKLEESCLASKWFIPAKVSGDDPSEWLEAGEADAVIAAPAEGLTKSFKRNEGKIQILIDATNAIRARQIESYIKAIAGKVIAEETKSGMKPVQLLTADIRIFYNPSMESAVFLVPGVMCMILCIVTVILTSMSLVREKEMGTFETLISAPISNREILVGKTLPYILLGMIDVPIILSVAIFLFGVPMRGGIVQLFFAALVFVTTTVSIGTLISTYAKTQQQAMMGGFLFLFPALLLSGIMFPVENIPDIFKVIAYLDPLKYFVTLLRNIMLKGGNAEVFWTNILYLCLIAAFTVTLSAARFKQKLN